MIDNLKIGYGGTQTEMLKLAKDMGVINKSVKSFADMSFDESILAIHKLQEQLEITGVAGDEALTTMTGSIQMFKASWQNFLSGQGNLGQVVESARIAFQNILNIVNEALPDIVENIVDWMPELVNTGTEMIGAIAQGIFDNLPVILNVAGEIISNIANGINQNISGITDGAMEIIDTIITGLADNMDSILEKGIDILISIINGISKALPDLVPKIVEIIKKIVVTLISHLPEIINAGVQLIIALRKRYYISYSTVAFLLRKCVWCNYKFFFKLNCNGS